MKKDTQGPCPAYVPSIITARDYERSMDPLHNQRNEAPEGGVLRKVGELPTPEQAKIFRRFLQAQDVEVHLGDTELDCEVWIYDDQQLIRARELFHAYRESPSDAKYLAFRPAERVAKIAYTRVTPPRRSKVEDLLRRATDMHFVTIAMIVVCVILFLAQGFNGHAILRRWLWFSNDHLLHYLGVKSFSEILSGQVWRLVTPIFLHANLMHIAFNLIWLFQLGRPVEEQLGSLRYWGFILCVAAVSNTVFYLAVGPAFEGMSGVIYGLVGYIWGSQQWGHQRVIWLDPGLMRFFLGWYVLCWVLTAFGLHVANTIHGVGGFAGVAFAFVHFRAYVPFFRTGVTRDGLLLFSTLIALLFGGVFTDMLFY